MRDDRVGPTKSLGYYILSAITWLPVLLAKALRWLRQHPPRTAPPPRAKKPVRPKRGHRKNHAPH